MLSCRVPREAEARTPEHRHRNRVGDTVAGSHTSWWWSYRLTVVRGFAAQRCAIDPTTEMTAIDLLPCNRPGPSPTSTRKMMLPP